MTDDKQPQDEQAQPEIPQPGEEEIEIAPQIVYGISIFMMDNGHPHVELTANPSLLQLQMLIAPALANIESDITAEKVVHLMKSQAIERARQMQTAQLRKQIIEKPHGG